MADTPAPKGKSGKGFLHAKFHGVPLPAIAAGSGIVVFLLYKWYKGRQTAANSTTPASANPAATGLTGTGSDFTGTGTGGGGGGGSFFGHPPITGTGDQPVNPTAGPAPAPAPTPDGNTPQPLAQPVAAPLPTQQGLQSVSVPVAQAGSTATGAGGNPNGTAGVFQLSRGTVYFQPTAAVVKGNQVAYGIGNPNDAAKVRAAGGTVLSGSALESRGWQNLTPGAQYLLR